MVSRGISVDNPVLLTIIAMLYMIDHPITESLYPSVNMFFLN